VSGSGLTRAGPSVTVAARLGVFTEVGRRGREPERPAGGRPRRPGGRPAGGGALAVDRRAAAEAAAAALAVPGRRRPESTAGYVKLDLNAG
jgi:hypothetical protein